MSKTSDDEKGRWDQVMDHFDLAFQQMNDIALIQQEIKKDLTATKEQQKMIAQQVRANGQAVASLTLRQMEKEAVSDHSDDVSVIFEEADDFQNIFAKNKTDFRPGTSKHPTRPDERTRQEALPHHSLPKIHFPKFNGSNPKIWFDNCANYFTIYSIPEHLKVTAATMHLEGNASKWWQAYKQSHAMPGWIVFCQVIQEKFGADDYRNAINELLSLKQMGTVEEYTAAFQSLQFDIAMHNCHYDELFFATTYVQGLKDEIRAMVEPHVPVTVERATVIAKIQQRTLERSKSKYNRAAPPQKPAATKTEVPPQQTNYNWQRIRQLRDYRRANNLCFSCGEKYEPGHQEHCPKRQKPQVHALAINDLDKDKEELTEEMLNTLAVEDTLAEDFCQLSLNTLSSQDTGNSMKLKTMVKEKVMLILLDSGSSHSFISADFVRLAKLPTIPIPSRTVKLANGQCLSTSSKVQNLQWYIQGHTLCSDMIVLDMTTYDAILGYDWLKEQGPMAIDWTKKTLQFKKNNKPIKLQGLISPPLQAKPISATKLYKDTKGNNSWAFVIVKHTHPPNLTTSPTPTEPPPPIQQVLDKYSQVFQDPKTLPPSRSYDHSIPLLPGATPVNARPYHYSPQHKTEIENQVQELLQSGLIIHSHSPFASHVLLVKKKDGSW